MPTSTTSKPSPSLSTSQKGNKPKKSFKKCRLLSCAFNARHTESVALIATHLQVEDVNGEELENGKCNQSVSDESPMKKIKLDEANDMTSNGTNYETNHETNGKNNREITDEAIKITLEPEKKHRKKKKKSFLLYQI